MFLFCSKIQSVTRGNFVRALDKMKGPALYNRKYVNSNDFLMFEEIKSISNNQFLVSNDNFVYGFNICSIYNLLYIENVGKKALNPYNRNEISKEVYNNVWYSDYQIVKINFKY